MRYNEIIKFVRQQMYPHGNLQRDLENSSKLFGITADRLKDRNYKQYTKYIGQTYDLLRADIPFYRFKMFRHPNAGANATLLTSTGIKKLANSFELIRQYEQGDLYERKFNSYAVGIFEITKKNTNGNLPDKGDIALYINEPNISSNDDQFDPEKDADA